MLVCLPFCLGFYRDWRRDEAPNVCRVIDVLFNGGPFCETFAAASSAPRPAARMRLVPCWREDIRHQSGTKGPVRAKWRRNASEAGRGFRRGSIRAVFEVFGSSMSH